MNKKVLLLLLLFIFVLSCNTVFANDNITDDSEKIDSYIIAESNNIKVEQDENILIKLPENASGTVTITVNGNSENVEVVNQTFTYTISNLAFGNYTANVNYSGDSIYKSSNNITSFNVYKWYPMCNVSYERYLDAFDTLKLTITPMVDESGNVTFLFLNTSKEYEFDGVELNITYSDLEAGQYQFTLVFSGNEKYYTKNGTFGFTVLKINTPISATGENITEGNLETIEVKLANRTSGSITATINNKNYTCEVNNGSSIINISDLDAENYTAEIYYTGDKNYNSNKTTVTFSVTEKIDENTNDTTPVDNETLDAEIIPKNELEIVNKTDYENNTISDKKENIQSNLNTGNPIFILLIIFSILVAVSNRKK